MKAIFLPPPKETAGLPVWTPCQPNNSGSGGELGAGIQSLTTKKNSGNGARAMRLSLPAFPLPPLHGVVPHTCPVPAAGDAMDSDRDRPRTPLRSPGSPAVFPGTPGRPHPLDLTFSRQIREALNSPTSPLSSFSRLGADDTYSARKGLRAQPQAETALTGVGLPLPARRGWSIAVPFLRCNAGADMAPNKTTRRIHLHLKLSNSPVDHIKVELQRHPHAVDQTVKDKGVPSPSSREGVFGSPFGNA